MTCFFFPPGPSCFAGPDGECDALIANAINNNTLEYIGDFQNNFVLSIAATHLSQCCVGVALVFVANDFTVEDAGRGAKISEFLD